MADFPFSLRKTLSFCFLTQVATYHFAVRNRPKRVWQLAFFNKQPQEAVAGDPFCSKCTLLKIAAALPTGALYMVSYNVPDYSITAQMYADKQQAGTLLGKPRLTMLFFPNPQTTQAAQK